MLRGSEKGPVHPAPTCLACVPLMSVGIVTGPGKQGVGVAPSL